MLCKQCYEWCLSLAAPCTRSREMPFPRESHNNDSAAPSASPARPHVGRAGASPSPEMAILVTNECWMCPVVSDVPEAAGRVQQGKDCSVLTISDAHFLRIHHCWRGDAVLDGVLDGIPQMSMEAERQEGKQERRGVIYYSWGHCLLFSVCFSVSFPFPPTTHYRIMANELRNKIIREN